MALDPKLADMLAKKGIDVNKYKKTEEPKKEESKKEKQTTTKNKPTQTKLDLSKYKKTPTKPEPNEKRGDVEVKLNAPENYLDTEPLDKTIEAQKNEVSKITKRDIEKALLENTLQDDQTRLSVEEKEMLKTLLNKLVDSI